MDASDFSRIAAQTAKQVIIQRVREAERETIFNEYKDRVGELINGIVRRFEKGDLVIDLGRAEAVLPHKEQAPREVYRQGDRVKALILDIRMTTKGPQIILSRINPGLLEKLFEAEVPEVSEGIVEIMGVVREPGSRAKIAVYSHESDVDPVGACVGMRGSRVQNVVSELRGEKIDIIPWSEDIARFACNALAPAVVSKVYVDEENRAMEIIVADDQLSLAIGKRGQNVRLAAKLTNWKIDIKSEEEKRQEVETAMAALVAPGAPVAVLLDYGVGDKVVESLLEAGVGTIEKLGGMTPEELEEIPGIGEKTVERIQMAVNAYYNQFEQPEAVEAEGLAMLRFAVHGVAAVDEICRIIHSGAEERIQTLEGIVQPEGRVHSEARIGISRIAIEISEGTIEVQEHPPPENGDILREIGDLGIILEYRTIVSHEKVAKLSHPSGEERFLKRLLDEHR